MWFESLKILPQSHNTHMRLSLVTFLVVGVTETSATSIKMDYLPTGFARTDPIISKNCLSDHVHTFYGPQLLRPETDYDALINSPDEINTGNGMHRTLLKSLFTFFLTITLQSKKTNPFIGTRLSTNTTKKVRLILAIQCHNLLLITFGIMVRIPKPFPMDSE